MKKRLAILLIAAMMVGLMPGIGTMQVSATELVENTENTVSSDEAMTSEETPANFAEATVLLPNLVQATEENTDDSENTQTQAEEETRTLHVGTNSFFTSSPLVWYEFTPDETGMYKFSSTKISSGSFYVNTEKNQAGGTTIAGCINGCSLYYELEKDTPYYVAASEVVGECDLTLTKLDLTLKVGCNENFEANITSFGGPLVWYEFTPLETGTYQFSSTKMTNANICVNTTKNNNAGQSSISDSPTYELTAETTYYVSANCTPGSYDLTIAKLDRTLKVGTNDFYVNPQMTVWYVFTPTETGTYQFSSTEMVGAFYFNTTNSTSGVKAVNLKDSPTYELTAGTTYYMSGYYSPGNYDLTIAKIDKTLKIGSTENFEVNDPLVWYEFTPDITGVYCFEMTEAEPGTLYVNTTKEEKNGIDITLAPVYELEGGTTYYVAVSGDPGIFILSIKKVYAELRCKKNRIEVYSYTSIWHEFTPTETGTYRFRIPSMTSGEEGSLYICVNTARNNAGVAATDIRNSPAYELNEGTTYYVQVSGRAGVYAMVIDKLAKTLNVDANSNFSAGSPLIWYEFTPPKTGIYRFSSSSSEITQMDTFYVNTDKKQSNGRQFAYSPTYELEGGITYYVAASCRTPGSYDLTIEELDRTLNVGTNNNFGVDSSLIWYEFTPDETGMYMFSSSEMRGSGNLYVNTKKDTTEGEVFIYDYSDAATSYKLTGGTTYYVALNTGATGKCALQIEKLPPLVLGSNNFEASRECIWHEFTPTETGFYQFSSTKMTSADLYFDTTATPTTLTKQYVGDITDSPVCELNAGTTYYVMVDHSRGSYELTIKKLEPLQAGTNDFYVNHQRPVWYEFRPTETGTYQFSSTKMAGSFYVNMTKNMADGCKDITTKPLYELNAGTTYYVAASYTPGSYDLTIERMQYKVTLTSKVAGNNESESVVTLTGGGVYDALKKVTVFAPEKEGFTFAGWYTEGYEEESEPVCNTLAYTFTLNENTDLVAVYNPNDSIELSVNGDSNAYSVNGTTQASDSFIQTFKAGSSITVKYTGSGKFCYWMNDSGKIVSRNPEYTFSLVSNITVTAVAVGTDSGSEETGYSALVEFVSYYGQVMQAETWSSNDTASQKTLPAAPSKLGGTFKYWSIDGVNEATAETIIDAIDGSATRITVTPIYEEITTAYTVTIKYPDELGKEDKVYDNLKLGNTLTVTADAVEGKEFAYWAGDKEGTEKLSYNKSYFIIISGDVVLYPIYTDTKIEAEPVISVTNVYTSVVSGMNKVSFEITRSVPDTYAVVETGVLGIIDGTYSESSDMTIDSSTVKKAVSSSTSNNGIYTININVTEKLDTTLAVRGYMIVKNKATGNISVIYTDTKTATYNTAK